MAAAADLMGRITVRQDVFGGKPIIRDLRMAVEHVLGMLAAGESSETILREHPVLEPEPHFCNSAREACRGAGPNPSGLMAPKRAAFLCHTRTPLLHRGIPVRWQELLEARPSSCRSGGGR